MAGEDGTKVAVGAPKAHGIRLFSPPPLMQWVELCTGTKQPLCFLLHCGQDSRVAQALPGFDAGRECFYCTSLSQAHFQT